MFLNVKHDNVTKSMQLKDYSLTVFRFQQITDASFLFSKGLHWKMVNMVILQSTLKLNETQTFDKKYQGANDEAKHSRTHW